MAHLIKLKMTSTNKLIIGALGTLALISAFIFAGIFLYTPQDSLAGGDGFSANNCVVSTSTAISVGVGSTQVVGTTSRRAWAQIQQVDAATNTVSLNFNNGAQAVIATAGMQLGQGSASSTAQLVSFGLNTDFSYTGAVTAITDKGSTTVRVVECNYTR
jgi:hypothetical protein